MSRYLVTRQERWDQVVVIDAPSEEEARRRVVAGFGFINSDPEFVDFIFKENWNAEKVPEDSAQEELKGITPTPPKTA